MSAQGTARSGSAYRDAVSIAALLATITGLHLVTDPSGQWASMHLLYRRLFYVPILYAGFVFGRRGGAVTGLAAAVLYGFHAQLSMGGLLGPGLDNLYETVSFVVLGSLFGWMRDLADMRTADLRIVSSQLQRAYHKLEERALQLSSVQEYTQAILRSVTAGVMTLGPDGSIVTANPAAERLLGQREPDLVPRRIQAVLADDGGLDADVSKVLAGRAPRIVRETKIVTRNGKAVHVQVSISRMRDAEGRILGAVVALEDMSEVKALTDQLIRSDRLAAMGELTAGVAHEVRNPLGIIRASVQLIEESNGDPERIAEATSVVKQEIDRLDRVIKALLDFGRPSAPAFRAVKVADVIDDVVLFTRRFAREAHVSISYDIPPDIPYVRADPDQMKQVFVNLISNAVQAMQGRGGSISLSARADGGFVAIRVEDDGPGIPEAELPKIFDPFYSTKDDGTGLGLTMVHRIVDDHDGYIEVASRVGEGTSFTVYFPAATGSED
ncbi:ATP-binding protein [Coriobacteriia bacterium Es71-Z0120]|uniref:two-component system sensor histidine kinase NtrB n=1 Tax=Parvivirga hydrogeniphila TaxID=2939460 RepID=UPI002260CC57|nr:ATP-binding protein [Parvivirga hydrogeniphila]MCL4078900.1 ATP-binding protein [Parvivirga hydrogeniphila]